MFHYFVSYSFSGSFQNGLKSGFGCCEITRDKPITCMRDIQEICDVLSSEQNLGDFCVLNYQLLKYEEPDAK